MKKTRNLSMILVTPNPKMKIPHLNQQYKRKLMLTLIYRLLRMPENIMIIKSSLRLNKLKH
jgi:hypothetical protein